MPASAPKRSKKGKKRGKGSAAEAEIDLAPEDVARLVPLPRSQPGGAALGWQPLQLSRTDKAPQLNLAAVPPPGAPPDDAPLLLSVTGSKGFRTARASHGVHVGTWYCEVTVAHMGASGHCRLGFATRKAELQAPVGYDTFGYSYRDVDGSRVHAALRETYGQGYAEGDVIGMLIHLPAGGRPMEANAQEVVRYKGSLWAVAAPEPQPAPLPGSLVAFSRNGVPQGTAFTDLLEGTYYPAASLYTLPEQREGATVTFNFGPHFAHQPPAVDGAGPARPMCEAAGEPPAAQAPAPAAAGLPVVSSVVPLAAAAMAGAQAPAV